MSVNYQFGPTVDVNFSYRMLWWCFPMVITMVMTFFTLSNRRDPRKMWLLISLNVVADLHFTFC